MLCFQPKKNYSRFCCCLPLALGTFCLGLAFGTYGVMQIVMAVTSKDWFSWGQLLPLLLGILVTLGGLGAVMASCCCTSAMMVFVKRSYQLLCLSIIVSFVIQWIVWGIMIAQDKDKSEKRVDIISAAIYTVISVIVFIILWWGESIIASHHAVLKSGGNGWEYKDYMEIREARALENA